LPFPGLFRFTCYYYRKAYYRSFVASPPGCAVSPGQRPKYWGETRFLLFQNLHRYALYFALAFVLLLSYDAVLAFFKDGHFGVGVGSLVLTVNAGLIACYTFGCHSLRHLVGGMKDILSRAPVRKTAYDCVSCLNRSHMKWAWVSMFFVGFADAYVRLCAMGVWHDWRIL
jgi:hypothetical protein